MYSIYHIPDFKWIKSKYNGRVGKIGCTTRLKQRIKKLGVTNWELLEEHDCIDIASNRELELQREYGYPTDDIPYKVTVKNSHYLTKYNKNKRKPVLQYTKEGNLVKEWESYHQVFLHYKEQNKHPAINRCLLGLLKTSDGYKWKYKSKI